MSRITRVRALETWSDEDEALGEGLAALLAWARCHGITAADWTPPATDEETGLALLLCQASEERRG